jgi:hypothetical protein
MCGGAGSDCQRCEGREMSWNKIREFLIVIALIFLWAEQISFQLRHEFKWDGWVPPILLLVSCLIRWFRPKKSN